MCSVRGSQRWSTKRNLPDRTLRLGMQPSFLAAFTSTRCVQVPLSQQRSYCFSDNPPGLRLTRVFLILVIASMRQGRVLGFKDPLRPAIECLVRRESEPPADIIALKPIAAHEAHRFFLQLVVNVRLDGHPLRSSKRPINVGRILLERNRNLLYAERSPQVSTDVLFYLRRVDHSSSPRKFQ